MEEKVIIKSRLKNPISLCAFIGILGPVIYFFYNLMVAKSDYEYMNRSLWSKTYEYSDALSYAFGFSNGANYILVPLLIGLPIAAYALYKTFARVEITLTNKKVYGVTITGKRVDLPIDSISSVGTSIFSSLAVATSSGVIKFAMLDNRNELHSAISELLSNRQSKPGVATTIKQEIPQSNADELKKYKELLDSGIITQEEFDAKKKQLLGL